jgi:hypothetical protein
MMAKQKQALFLWLVHFVHRIMVGPETRLSVINHRYRMTCGQAGSRESDTRGCIA